MAEHRTTSLSLKALRFWWIVGMAITCVGAIAQPYNSRLGKFQVDEKKGCASFTLTVTNLSPGDCGMFPCTITWGDGTPNQQGVFVHTYMNAGTFTLSILYGGTGSDDLVITVDQNIQPNFEIYACSGARAAIKVVDNAYDQYVIDFKNDGSPDYILPFSNNILTPSYTYVPAGVYTASVRGRDLSSDDNCTAKTQPFTTLATLPTPSINTLTSVDDANITLGFTTAVNIQYRLEIALNNASTFQLFKTLYGVNTLAVPDLKLDENYYCFRLVAYDLCTPANSRFSNIVCTNRLVATAQTDINGGALNVITSNTSVAGVVNYSIARNNTPYVTVAANPYPDPDVVCKVDYCYRVTTNYGGGRTSTSLEKCVTSFATKTPTAIDNVTATVTNSGATFSWTQDPEFEPVGYQVRRSSDAGAFNIYATVAGSPFTDNGYATSGKFCYTLDYVDKCDNPSAAGSQICPVQLTGTLSSNNAISLSWSSYAGWKNGVNTYVLEKYNLKGTLIQSITLTNNTFTDDVPDPINQYVRYVIRALPVDAAMGESASNELTFIRNANLFYPTAFTPNNDQLNDGFIVSGQYIVKIKMTIFDRWGAAIYSSEKNEPWDGTSNGKPMPSSTYIWKVDITDRADRTFSEEGTIALFRN